MLSNINKNSRNCYTTYFKDFQLFVSLNVLNFDFYLTIRLRA